MTKAAKKVYRKMNYFLSFEKYVERIIKKNQKKKALILKEAERTKEHFEGDFRSLAERNLGGHSVGLYLSWHHYIESRMKKYLKWHLTKLKETNPRMKPIKL